MKKFIGLYPLSKTLRFELKPIGKTLENVERNGILNEDEKRAEDYKIAKKIIDNYHKYFIDKSLRDFKLKLKGDNKKDSLEEFDNYYKIKQKTDGEKKDFQTIQENLRKQITKRFTEFNEYKDLFKKELIKNNLLDFVKTEEEKKIIESFKDFTSYFNGFNINRSNMYSNEDKSTAIAFRLINQNLPKFIDNIAIFNKLKDTTIKESLNILYKDFEAYLNVNSIDEIFNLDYYTEILTQIQIDLYNSIIGGRTIEGDKKIKGLNEYINEYNQQHNKNERLPKFQSLYKQILADRDSTSFILEEFENDNEMLECIEKCYNGIKDILGGEHSLKYLLENIKSYDLEHIYIRNDLQLTNISQYLFSSWSTISKAIRNDLEKTNSQTQKESNEKYEDRINKLIKSFDNFSIFYINQCLKKYNVNNNDINIADYFSKHCIKNEREENNDLFSIIENNYNNVKDLLNTNYPEEKHLSQDENNVIKIKLLLDNIKEIQNFVKPLLYKGEEADKDNNFYSDFIELWNNLNDIINPLYNKVRNRMTSKPYSTEKIKINFSNVTLLDGWDVNKEKANTCVILRKDGLYYLGIMDKKHNKIFEQEGISIQGPYYEKMEYKLLPGANKMLPKVFFSNSRIKEFNPSKELLEKYKNGTHKKGDNFNINDCHALIDFFKSSINKHSDWKNFNFKFSDTRTYKDTNDFYTEVEQQGYSISFRNISINYIDKMVEEGKLYLFQIYNKDFSPYSKGTPNMHTLYWKMLFDENNLKNVIYKLNGQAEVFYRKSSLKRNITHPANNEIKNKNKLNQKTTSIFPYDLIKDKRYTMDKFQFHVPITLNFKSRGKENINEEVNNYIKENGIKHIIGIDRGERNLLYLVMVDLKGNIIKQYSLNEIVNRDKNDILHKTDYHSLLDEKEKDRDEARKSWKTIENIKELKEGYLSQVVHQISQMIVKYNAIVVLEDLNGGFKQSRQKVEKQVYQKFETMLIDKLNYFVDKKKAINEDGGLLNAYQLTNKFISFQKMGKQCGFLFYIWAWNTSKIDPVTGFVNLFDTRYENIEKARGFFNKFQKISYNKEKDWFEFSFDYNDFTTKAEDTKTNWTITTQGKRIKTFRNPTKNNEFDNEEFNLTNSFKELFSKYNINIQNIKEDISKQTAKEFFEKLLELFHFILQMRNSVTNTEKDYMISPVTNENGKFYNSENEREKGKNNDGDWISKLPVDADANGAYNIARKGLWLIKQIKESNDQKPKLAITNKEWLSFVQNFNK